MDAKGRPSKGHQYRGIGSRSLAGDAPNITGWQRKVKQFCRSGIPLRARGAPQVQANPVQTCHQPTSIAFALKTNDSRRPRGGCLYDGIGQKCLTAVASGPGRAFPAPHHPAKEVALASNCATTRTHAQMVCVGRSDAMVPPRIPSIRALSCLDFSSAGNWIPTPAARPSAARSGVIHATLPATG